MSRCFIAAFMTLIVGKLFAINPILPTLDQNFPPQVLVSAGSYIAQYSFKSQLPFTMVFPLVISKYPSSPEFTFVDNCTGKKLRPQESCTVQISLRPLTAGVKTVRLVIERYDNNQVPLQLTTTATANSGVTIQGTVVTPLPASMHIDTTANYQFRFTNTGIAAATGVLVHTNDVGSSTTCTPVLQAGASCDVSGSFTPVSITPSTQNVTATFDFTQGAPVSVQTSTQVTAAASLTGTVVQGLNDITYTGTNYPVHFQFTNNSAANIPIGPNVNVLIQCALVSDNCPYNGNLAPFASCDVFCNFSAAFPGNYTETAQLVPSSSSPPAVKLSVSTQTVNPGPSRNIFFINQCPFPVWFSLNGATRQENGVDITCTSDDNCPAGSLCGPSGATTRHCFWANYAPADDNFQL